MIPGDEGRGSDGGALARQREEDVGFLPEADFGFDAEGNLVELGPPVWAAQGAAPTARMVGRESEAASARVRREHEEGARAGVEVRFFPALRWHSDVVNFYYLGFHFTALPVSWFTLDPIYAEAYNRAS